MESHFTKFNARLRLPAIQKYPSLNIAIKSYLSLESVVPDPETESLVLVAVKGVDAHTTVTNSEECYIHGL